MATSIPVIHSNVGDSYTTPVDVTLGAGLDGDALTALTRMDHSPNGRM